MSIIPSENLLVNHHFILVYIFVRYKMSENLLVNHQFILVYIFVCCKILRKNLGPFSLYQIMELFTLLNIGKPIRVSKSHVVAL